MEMGVSDVSPRAHISPQIHTLKHARRRYTGTKQRFWGINPNFKSSAFRPAWITHPNLPALTLSLPFTLCLHSSLAPFIIHPLSHLISFYLRLPPSLFHNSLSHYNSLYSINSFSPYFTVPSRHRLLLINHPIYLSLSVKVSACYSPSFLSQAVYVSLAAVSGAVCYSATCSNLLTHENDSVLTKE